MTDRSVIVMGAGDATGGAIAKRFAREGFQACLVRRSADKLAPLVEEIAAAGGAAAAFGCDASDEAAVTELFARIEKDVAPIGAVVFNAGAFLRAPAAIDLDAERFTESWRTNCLGGFLTGREAVRHMAPRGVGTLIFTGATASLRGGKGFAAFASAKFGLRAVAQSLAREFMPQGIHVAHVIVDGVIETPRLPDLMPSLVEKKGTRALLSPEGIAETYWMLHCQPPRAWSHEIDLRPAEENW